MGVGKAYSLHEIDATRAKVRDDQFEAILERVKEAGGEISKDETAPLYDEIGTEEAEIGYERVVEFNLNKFDFQMTRRVREKRIVGEGHHKSLEATDTPMIKLTLKRKPESSDTWQMMDLEDLL
ncbi:hypothetical protein KJ632_00415 [Patescibacteria group bacterium]|nr:hypothetical protein [Patescibacteria group bacterium]